MTLFCACAKCYKTYCRESYHEACAKVFNALYIRPDSLMDEPLDEIGQGLFALAYAAVGAQPGVIHRRRIERLVNGSLGEKLLNSEMPTTSTGRLADAVHANEQRMRVISHICLKTIHALCPHHFLVPGTQISEQSLDEFRYRQGRAGIGHAALFYSYSEGTRLYFSDETEAVMARLVFAPESRSL